MLWEVTCFTYNDGTCIICLFLACFGNAMLLNQSCNRFVLHHNQVLIKFRFDFEKLQHLTASYEHTQTIFLCSKNIAFTLKQNGTTSAHQTSLGLLFIMWQSLSSWPKCKPINIPPRLPAVLSYIFTRAMSRDRGCSQAKPEDSPHNLGSLNHVCGSRKWVSPDANLPAHPSDT